ncbi:hypothetical protein [Paraburkholderia acidisoli]|uniref:Oligosaccharide repeat unit polymerase n=1 Tax=Paraburkholderia acidisoli TaxID=2571748 RepID=A0A7Z2JEP4_9BURK|nr:hypothetical protein [Paraburkholderia acidisoli]QGZ60699.1 hypothetical protein FAZ98_02505 [Paraburkholderia acidisoli]
MKILPSRDLGFSLISPNNAAVYSFIICVIFTTFTAYNYTDIVGEPNLMFLNWRVLTYVIACILAYSAGVSVATKFRFPRISLIGIHFSISRRTFYLIPMLISCCATIYVGVALIESNNLFVLFLESVANTDIKGSLEVDPIFFYVLYSHIAITLWASKEVYDEKATNLVRYMYWFMCILTVTVSLLILARYVLIPFLMCIGVLRVRARYIKKGSVNHVAIFAAISALVGLFVLIAVARGGQGFEALYNYGPASFNRLAAVLAGRIDINVPSSYYIMSSFKHDWSYYEIVMNEHDAVEGAGLDWSLNWLTAYGYVFQAIGVFSLLYFFVIGLISGFAWSGFKVGKSWAIVFYPWIFSSVILWFTYNIAGYAQTYILLIVGTILGGYSRLFGMNVKFEDNVHSSD